MKIQIVAVVLAAAMLLPLAVGMDAQQPDPKHDAERVAALAAVEAEYPEQVAKVRTHAPHMLERFLQGEDLWEEAGFGPSDGEVPLHPDVETWKENLHQDMLWRIAQEGGAQAPASHAAQPAAGSGAPQAAATTGTAGVDLVDDDAAAPAGGLDFPSRTFRKWFPVCDINGDGYDDLITNDWDGGSYYSPASSNIRGVDGATGNGLWYHENGDYLPFIIGPLTFGTYYTAPHRAALPEPQWPTAPPYNALPAPDVNGDGVCDFMAFQVDMEWPFTQLPLLLGVAIIEFRGELKMLDGTNGQVLWSNPIESDFTSIFTPPLCSGLCPTYEKYEVTGYPTGWESFNTTSGPKFVWKTTDVEYEGSGPPGATMQFQFVTIEHVVLGDSRDGSTIWQRDLINPSAPNSIGYVTWLSGVGDLAGDGEKEVVLDDNYLRIRALRGELEGGEDGEAGADHFAPVGFFTPPQRGDLSIEEETQQRLIWTYVNIVDDITGDGYQDPVPTYLTGPPLGKFPVNQDYLTHLAPMDGQEGTLLWEGKDVKYQGWGFVDDLGPGTGLLALGTADLPTPQLPGTKFPFKEFRVIAMDVESGMSEWSVKDRFATDDYRIYHMALWQFLEALAPSDMDGDGVLDPVTPARYVPPKGAVQVLFSTATHLHDVIDGRKGSVMSELEVWGSTGMVLACEDAPEHTLTVLTGSTRRYDVVRVDARSGEVLWRMPVHNDPRPPAMSVGGQTIFLWAACQDGHDEQTVFAMDAGLISFKRGFEIVNPALGVGPDLRQLFLAPPLRGSAPLEPSLDFIVKDKGIEVSTGAQIGMTGGALGLGALGGLGSAFLRGRRS